MGSKTEDAVLKSPYPDRNYKSIYHYFKTLSKFRSTYHRMPNYRSEDDFEIFQSLIDESFLQFISSQSSSSPSSPLSSLLDFYKTCVYQSRGDVPPLVRSPPRSPPSLSLFIIIHSFIHSLFQSSPHYYRHYIHYTSIFILLLIIMIITTIIIIITCNTPHGMNRKVSLEG